MQIRFEFEDGTSETISGVEYSKINEKSEQNHLIDAFLSDPMLVNIYLMANDNRMA